MKTMQTVTDSYNAFLGTIIAILTMVFGEHWFIFALFLLSFFLNVLKKLKCFYYIYLVFFFVSLVFFIKPGKLLTESSFKRKCLLWR